MNKLDEIKKRLAYVESNNLFEAHYINDMKYLIKSLQLANQYIGALKKQRAQEDEACVSPAAKALWDEAWESQENKFIK